MKNIVIILALFLTIPSFSQNMERWDSKTAVYSNFEWGFSWTLPNEVTWEKSSGMERHTVFRAINPDLQLTVFVNINPASNNVKLSEDTPWDKFEFIKKQLTEIENSIPDAVGGRVTESHVEKVKFGGKKAIKNTYITRYDDDDRYKNDPYEVYAVTYTFVHKNANWSVSFKLYKDILDYAGEEIIDEVFRGFNFIVSDSDTKAIKRLK